MIVWNDDVTTFQTVIQAFVEIFGHTVERADQLAWKIHRTGKAVAAVRPKDEAEAAVHALHRARHLGHARPRLNGRAVRAERALPASAALERRGEPRLHARPLGRHDGEAG